MHQSFIMRQIKANNIKKFRLEKKLTQQELADLVDTNQQSVCRWESGKHGIEDETVERIAEKLGIDPRRFYCEGVTDEVCLSKDADSKPALSDQARAWIRKMVGKALLSGDQEQLPKDVLTLLEGRSLPGPEPPIEQVSISTGSDYILDLTPDAVRAMKRR